MLSIISNVGVFYISLLFWESFLVTYKAVSSDRSEIKGWYPLPAKKADILYVLALKICFSRNSKTVKVLKGRSQSDT